MKIKTALIVLLSILTIIVLVKALDFLAYNMLQQNMKKEYCIVATNYIKENPNIRKHIGLVSNISLFLGPKGSSYVRYINDNGYAQNIFEVVGLQGRGKVQIKLEKINGPWKIVNCILFQENGKEIQISDK